MLASNSYSSSYLMEGLQGDAHTLVALGAEMPSSCTIRLDGPMQLRLSHKAKATAQSKLQDLAPWIMVSYKVTRETRFII